MKKRRRKKEEEEDKTRKIVINFFMCGLFTTQVYIVQH